MSAERTILVLRQALRRLARRRNDTTAIVLILGVGLGLLSAVFALVDPLLFRPLPYSQPGELVVIRIGSTSLKPDFQFPTLDQWRARTDLFEGLAAHEGALETVRTPEGPVYMHMLRVTQNFFVVLGVPVPELSSKAQINNLEIVLTHKGAQLVDWEVNRDLTRADGTELRAAAVLANDFLLPIAAASGLDGVSFFKPERVAEARSLPGVGGPTPQAVGPTLLARLKPNVSFERLTRELAASLAGGGPMEVRVRSLDEVMTGERHSFALGVFLAGVLLLLVCLGNVCSLLIAQQAYRSHEAGIRRALGARRQDLVADVLSEAALLVAASSLLALMIANWVVAASAVMMPKQFASLGAPSLTTRCAVFCALAAIAIAAILTVPMLRSERRAGSSLLSHKVASKVRDSKAIRICFGAFQATLAIVFAIGSGMLGQSYLNLVSQNEGFSGHVFTTEVQYPFQRAGSLLYEDVEATLAKLQSMPGVLTTAATSGPLVNRVEATRSVAINGTPISVSYSQVTQSFFQAAGIPILQGRALRRADEHYRGVVVNEAFMRSYFPHSDANDYLGQVVIHGPYHMEVVGVVRDVFDKRLDTKPEPTIYGLIDPERLFPVITYVIQCSDETAVGISLVRRHIKSVNPEAIVFSTELLSGRLSATVRDKEFAAFALVLFGVASVSITVFGLVGIVSFVTARRSRELAIRVALGASSGHIRWLVTREAAIAAVTGCGAGLAIGQPLSHVLASLVYGVNAGSWSIAICASLFTSALMLGSSFLAAAQVNRIQPAEAFRRD